MRRIARGWKKWAAVCVLAAALGNDGGARLYRPASAPVPAGQEIEILDPGVDPTGNPRALVRPGPAGTQLVDVPPPVIVHKFYPTGDRNFQGPMLPGGNVIIVVNHPKTLERVYVPAVIPPGIPRIYYTSNAIRYDYGPQSVTLSFGHCGNPTISYSQSPRVVERGKKAAATVGQGTRSWVQRTGIPEGFQRFGQTAKNAVQNGTDTLKDVGKMALTPLTQMVRMIPGVEPLLSQAPADRIPKPPPLNYGAFSVPPTIDNQFIPRGP